MSGTTLRTQPNQGHHFMTPYAWLQRWSACFTMAITMAVVLWGCASEPLAKVRLVNVPRHYVRMAEPGTTLTTLTAHPEMYRGKVVLLGGTIIEEEENEQDLWLHLINRPLDQDYIPHRPAGHEWSRSWLLLGGGGKATIPPPVSTVGANDGGRTSNGHAAIRGAGAVAPLRARLGDELGASRGLGEF